MPLIEVNGCVLFYEVFGEDQPDKSPVLLIHGSTQTGHSCWGFIAPLLAREYRVIVPDCRGHGQSTNPGLSYAFEEMAQDCVELIRALGYKRAHVIGHSNGGNVALVTLVEHPDVVQSVVLQAANAYVSPDLIEKEPQIFNPERVERETPEWMNEMIDLHAATHGTDYWRKLLQLTVSEIISEPNYSGGNLAQVDKPVLVIQGENDRVNAPSRHAQFIHENTPFAQLWIPQGVGHNVHEEIPCEWVDRVVAFLRERGSATGETLYRFQRSQPGDQRTTIFEVHTAQERNELGYKLTLTGKVLTGDQSDAVVSFLRSRGEEIDPQLQVLISESTAWGIINRPIDDLRKSASNRAERLSQLLLSEVVRILEQQNEWTWVRMEDDGYLGWVHSSALQAVSSEALRHYQETCNACVISGLLEAFKTERNSKRERWGQLPFGVKVNVIEWGEDEARILLPDGRLCSAPRVGLVPVQDLPTADSTGKLFALGLIERFIGVPYLWGGRSPYGFDCSGLAQIYYKFMKVLIPRDADQQYQAGEAVLGDPQPGDLLFFGEAEANNHGRDRVEHISHVAISMGDDELIHANGTAWGVSLNSLNPDSPRYFPWLRDHLIGIRRYT